MKLSIRSVVIGAFFVAIVGAWSLSFVHPFGSAPAPDTMEAAAAAVISSLNYLFSVAGTLQEAGSMDESSSPYFWLNSGGKLLLAGGLGSTILGDLPASDKWYKLYAQNNPADTDGGAHPQNLFRLVTRSKWNNALQQANFQIVADHFSPSSNRNASNGLLFMSRYTGDGQTLYYAGVRVDGYAVIKKKYHGTYYTMASKRIFPGVYSVGADVNLLPHAQWFTLQNTTVTNADGSVTVTLSAKLPGATSTTPLVSATDSGGYGGTPPITGAQYDGIRTDFMDVEFDNYQIKPL